MAMIVIEVLIAYTLARSRVVNIVSAYTTAHSLSSSHYRTLDEPALQRKAARSLDTHYL